MARQAYGRGDFQQAVEICDQMLARTGKNEDLLNLKALSLLASGHFEAAETVTRQVLKLNPRQAGIHLNAARIYQGMSQNKQVKRHAREALRLAPREAPVLYQAALMFRDCGDYSMSLRILDRCISLVPDFSHALHLKGSILIDLGDLSAAQETLEKAVSANPGNARALSDLITIRHDCLTDTQTVAMLEQMRHGDLAPPDRATAVFSLAHMHHREGQHDPAFALFREANGVIAATSPFNFDAWEQRINRVIQATGGPEKFISPDGSAGSNLVFIIGMPRSGTSLCEQVLSAHTGVMACGELAAMQHIEASFDRHGIDPYLLQTDPGSRPAKFERASTLYLSVLPKDQQKYHLVTDKAPMNFERIGLIHQLFPGARFLYCTRHPLDTIVSCYFQNFQAGVDFAADLEQITRVYISQLHLMRHWITLLPHYIHRVSYESLVSDLDKEAKAIAEFLQIDFEAAMLEPHKQQRTVTTASNLQVRKPVYTSSVDNWKNYRQHLGGVIELLKKYRLLDENFQPR